MLSTEVRKLMVKAYEKAIVRHNGKELFCK